MIIIYFANKNSFFILSSASKKYFLNTCTVKHINIEHRAALTQIYYKDNLENVNFGVI